ncbi:MAG TPA: hypothetical protein VFM18_15675 [Methanosarcina sp.]|nr:hypothetical protein [Methanosarcina sp.]
MNKIIKSLYEFMLASLSSIKINDLLYASRMAAKVDNAAVQDGSPYIIM